jgi:hypothetical protein
MLTAETLRDALDYDRESGLFLWKKFKNGNQSVGWFPGSKNSAGYPRINFGGKSYLAHRLAWLFVTGGWPEAVIDHIDGNPSNNRWANLRPATRAQNCMNSRPQGRSASGLKGVSLHSKSGKWVAHINGSYLGTFLTKDEARAVRVAAERDRFGEFARL